MILSSVNNKNTSIVKSSVQGETTIAAVGKYYVFNTSASHLSKGSNKTVAYIADLVVQSWKSFARPVLTF